MKFLLDNLKYNVPFYFGPVAAQSACTVELLLTDMHW